MNVALVVPEFPPDTIGGGGPVFEALALTLSRRGHGVRVLTSRTYGAPPVDDRRYPFPVRRVAQLPHFSSRFKTYMPPSPFGFSGVRKFLSGSDAYHLHGYAHAFIDTVFHFFVPPQRAIFTLHGFPNPAGVGGGSVAALYGMYDKIFGSKVLEKSARATAVSTLLAQKARAVSGREVAVIPNGFVPLPEGGQLDADLEREMRKGPYLLGVGRLEEFKGFHYTIEALAILRVSNPALRLLIAGPDNGQEQSLRALARRLHIDTAVSFLGAVPRDRLAHLYRRTACVVVSSKNESFSLVTLEAMSCGAPLAASAVGGILDIVSDGENALLFPAGDVAAIADHVERILYSGELKQRLADGGPATIARYSWDEVVAQYEREYASL